jgi:hypothetical protein
MHPDRIKDKEQLFFKKQVQILNRISIKIPVSKTSFEFELDLFDVQTCVKKSSKFSKILTCLNLPESEFRLA